MTDKEREREREKERERERDRTPTTIKTHRYMLSILRDSDTYKKSTDSGEKNKTARKRARFFTPSEVFIQPRLAPQIKKAQKKEGGL